MLFAVNCATCSLMSSARRIIVVLIQYGSVASHFGEDGATRRYVLVVFCYIANNGNPLIRFFCLADVFNKTWVQCYNYAEMSVAISVGSRLFGGMQSTGSSEVLGIAALRGTSENKSYSRQVNLSQGCTKG